MYFDEQEVLPTLVPINRKKQERQVIQDEPDPNKKKNDKAGALKIDHKKTFKEQAAKVQTEKELNSVENIPPGKIEEFETRFKSMNQQVDKKEKIQKIKHTDKWKQVQKSKFLVTEILHKIKAKNITQELYPVTNQTIDYLIKEMDLEINNLRNEQQKKQNSLQLNPNNQHLKHQLEVLKSSIDRAVTIKELYNDKIHSRNKIMVLEKSIIGLKEENANLKIIINRGVETIQNHMHNLPCEKEKQLNQELRRVNEDYRKERQMRQSLEKNISQIVLNFKRLYQEADTARLIVTKKLKQIQQKQKALAVNAALNASNEQKATSHKGTPDYSGLLQDRGKRSTRIADIKDNTPAVPLRTPQKIMKPEKDINRSRQNDKNVGAFFSMEEQIKKMRNNQITVKKRF